MEIGVLGPLRVLDAEGGEVALAGRQRTLLALLAIHVGEVVSTDRLIEELWGTDRPDNPANALQGRISQLRKVFGRSRVPQRAAGYVLDVPEDLIDARRFELAATRGHELLLDGQVAAARDVLAACLATWRGPAFQEFTGHVWAETESHRLEECRLSALEDRIDADLRQAVPATLVGELEQLVAHHPYRERFRGQLMLALYRAGRQAEALETFRQCRQLLAEELGLEPGEELQRLQSAILAQDPALRPTSDTAVLAGLAPTSPVTGAGSEGADAPRIRVLVVDDDPLVRSAVRSILATDPGILLVGEASDGRTAVESAVLLDADVVLMDVRMPGLDGIEATRQLLARHDGASVIVLTTFDRDEYVVRALEAGASGFLLKRTDPSKLPEAVRTVARGDAIVDPAVTKQLLGTFLHTREPSDAAPHERLAEDERLVFELLADGRSDSEIAEHLTVGRAVVERLVRTILDTLQVRDRTQAVVYAYKHGLVPN